MQRTRRGRTRIKLSHYGTGRCPNMTWSFSKIFDIKTSWTVAGRGKIWSSYRCLELWLYPGGIIYQEAFVPSQWRVRPADGHQSDVWNTMSCCLARGKFWVFRCYRDLPISFVKEPANLMTRTRVIIIKTVERCWDTLRDRCLSDIERCFKKM